MWQRSPKLLSGSILARLPIRKNYDENYFFDRWQGIPIEGYANVFKKLLSHKSIEIHLGVDFFEMRDQIPKSCLVFYSGPIDRFFDYRFGRLEWRSVDFERQVIDTEDFQGTSVMNYAELSVPYTRIHEPKHLHPERNYTKEKTLIFKEYPKSGTEGDPYYPVDTPENQNKLQRYLDESRNLSNVVFGGRLGEYKYYDMDQTIGSALKTYEHQVRARTVQHED
jgi:UDP-galactopyranose mutase